jgi:SPP1 family predicted phage head-tail adaptor
MAKWSDRATLIAVETPQEEQTDNEGFYLPPMETRREVFCNRQSVGYSEFYKSAQEGTKAELKITVRTDEYNAQGSVEYAGKRYKVMRTYVTKNGEFTELTLTDLPERGEGTEAGDGQL